VVLGELDNFPLSVVDMGHYVGGFGWFWGNQAIFALSGVDLKHCVSGFGWFWGTEAIFLYG
jgi:hypothetical protein